MTDKRTRQERIKKWIREQREFGKKFHIDERATANHIKMTLAGYDNIAGLDKRGLNAMGYKNSAMMKIKKYLPEKDYYVVWRKKRK